MQGTIYHYAYNNPRRAYLSFGFRSIQSPYPTPLLFPCHQISPLSVNCPACGIVGLLCPRQHSMLRIMSNRPGPWTVSSYDPCRAVENFRLSFHLDLCKKPELHFDWPSFLNSAPVFVRPPRLSFNSASIAMDLAGYAKANNIADYLAPTVQSLMPKQILYPSLFSARPFSLFHLSSCSSLTSPHPFDRLVSTRPIVRSLRNYLPLHSVSPSLITLLIFFSIFTFSIGVW